ncbi:MAG: hypothetical protein HY900_11510 [Deltaproteobacteria bacterium]|nr:hypothetical protein [Deltaproteobacteria bacterium]
MPPTLRLLSSVLLFVVCATFSAAEASSSARLRDGDLVFQRESGSDPSALQRATASPYTHVGMVLFRGGKPYVFEALETVRYTPLSAWTERGPGLIVKRLRDADRLLPPAAVRRLRAQAALLEGRPYDSDFRWSDDRIYCSELVWKLYDRVLGVQLGTPKKFREFDLDDPVVAEELRRRYGDAAPLDDLAISPGQVFASERLVAVTTRSPGPRPAPGGPDAETPR